MNGLSYLLPTAIVSAVLSPMAAFSRSFDTDLIRKAQQQPSTIDDTNARIEKDGWFRGLWTPAGLRGSLAETVVLWLLGRVSLSTRSLFFRSRSGLSDRTSERLENHFAVGMSQLIALIPLYPLTFITTGVFLLGGSATYSSVWSTAQSVSVSGGLFATLSVCYSGFLLSAIRYMLTSPLSMELANAFLESIPEEDRKPGSEMRILANEAATFTSRVLLHPLMLLKNMQVLAALQGQPHGILDVISPCWSLQGGMHILQAALVSEISSLVYRQIMRQLMNLQQGASRLKNL